MTDKPTEADLNALDVTDAEAAEINSIAQPLVPDAAPDGDTVFPAFDESAWVEAFSERHEPGEKDDHAFTYRVLERR